MASSLVSSSLVLAVEQVAQRSTDNNDPEPQREVGMLVLIVGRLEGALQYLVIADLKGWQLVAGLNEGRCG